MILNYYFDYYFHRANDNETSDSDKKKKKDLKEKK